MSILGLINNSSQQKVASVNTENLGEKVENMYKLGQAVLRAELQKAAEEATGTTEEDSKSDDEKKSDKKKAIIAKMKKDPEYKKKMEEEASK